jgi:hypothetical protein
VQAQVVENEVVRLGREVEDLGVGNGLGTGQAPGPDLREGGHHRGGRKPPVNLCEAILDLVGHRLAQERGRGAAAVARKRVAVEEGGGHRLGI